MMSEAEKIQNMDSLLSGWATCQIHSTESYKLFLEGFEQLRDNMTRTKVDHYQDGFSRLLNDYKNHRTSVEEQLSEIADEYNIFNVLKVKTNEVKTHTPFICNLLNPNGSHAQGDLFLKSFIELVFPEDLFILDYSLSYLRVLDEESTPKGVIDILIHSIKPENPFVIIIENKIYAPDQKRQLERYWEYAVRYLKMPKERIRLVYLKDGREPTDYSINPELKAELMDEKLLRCISYKVEIVNTLNKATTAIKAPNVKTLVNQYINIIKHLHS